MLGHPRPHPRSAIRASDRRGPDSDKAACSFVPSFVRVASDHADGLGERTADRSDAWRVMPKACFSNEPGWPRAVNLEGSIANALKCSIASSISNDGLSLSPTHTGHHVDYGCAVLDAVNALRWRFARAFREAFGH